VISAGDLRGAAVLAAAFLGVLAVAEAWSRLGRPDPEHTRKLVHLGGGGACLLFPFLVRSPWVVLAMAGGMTALFALGGRWGFLRSLHGVARPSRGAEYYPLAIFLVFLLARDRPWLYLAAVLVLAVGDAFAALVGGRYGRLRYQVQDEQKSLEGSLVFLVIAFLAIHLPMLLMTDLPRPVTVLAALLVAVLVTGFEAISLEGADNLFVPLAVVVILGKITSKPLGEVVFQNLSLAAICLLTVLVVWRFRAFNVGATITFILFAYGTWSLGNWQWAVPVFTGFAAYVAAWLHAVRDRGDRSDRRERGLRVRVVATALLAPFLVLAAANGLQQGPRFFGPYLAACGAVLALALPTGAWRLHRLGGAPWLAAAAGIGLAGWLATASVPWFVQRAVPAGSFLAVGAAVVAAALLNAAFDRRDPGPAARSEWTAPRFLLTIGAAAAVFAAQEAGWIAPWAPLRGLDVAPLFPGGPGSFG
jgi:phytol kinase